MDTTFILPKESGVWVVRPLIKGEAAERYSDAYITGTCCEAVNGAAGTRAEDDKSIFAGKCHRRVTSNNELSALPSSLLLWKVTGWKSRVSAPPAWTARAVQISQEEAKEILRAAKSAKSAKSAIKTSAPNCPKCKEEGRV